MVLALLRVAPMNKGQSLFQKGPITWLGFFALFCGFVVLWTEREAMFRIVIGNIAKAEQNFSLTPKDIDIRHFSIEKEPDLFGSNFFDEIGSRAIYESSEMVRFMRFDDPWMGLSRSSLVEATKRIIKIRGQVVSGGHILYTDDTSPIISGRLPIVLDGKGNHIFVAINVEVARLIWIVAGSAIQNDIFVTNADVGAQRSLLLIARSNSGMNGGRHYSDGQEGINPHTESSYFSPTKCIPVMLCAVFLGAAIFSFKGFYSDRYFMVIAGWFVAAICIAVLTFMII